MHINPLAQARVETVGDMPVLFIEDFYLDPDAVRAQALKAAYDLSIAFYPGRHASIVSSEARNVIEYLCRVLNALGDVTYTADAFITDFSIVTTRPGDLIANQAHPHTDPTPILGLVYLNPVNPVGTSFYENTDLNLRSLRTEEDRVATSLVLMEKGEEHAPDGYNVGASKLWHRYYTIEGVYNRLVVYPGNFFHAIDIKSVPDQLRIEEARLTQRFICHSVIRPGESI